MPSNSFLMKKLVKSEIYRSREQYMRPIDVAEKLLKSQILWLKKKKKGKRIRWTHKHAIQTLPKCNLNPTIITSLHEIHPKLW